MATFIQLSKVQKKEMAHHIAKCRRMNQHDLLYPSAEVKAKQAQHREQELAALAAAQQAADAMATATPIEMVRYNNAVKAQDAYRKGVTIRRKVEVTP